MVAIEVCRSPRLALGVALWGLGLICALAAMTAWPLVARVPLMLIAAALVLPTWLRVLWGHGPRAVRRIVWERDGNWTVMLASGVTERGCRLGHDSAAAGPWIWLGLHGRGHHCAVLDRSRQDAAGFAALRRRLQVERTAVR